MCKYFPYLVTLTLLGKYSASQSHGNQYSDDTFLTDEYVDTLMRSAVEATDLSEMLSVDDILGASNNPQNQTRADQDAQIALSSGDSEELLTALLNPSPVVVNTAKALEIRELVDQLRASASQVPITGDGPVEHMLQGLGEDEDEDINSGMPKHVTNEYPAALYTHSTDRHLDEEENMTHVCGVRNEASKEKDQLTQHKNSKHSQDGNALRRGDDRDKSLWNQMNDTYPQLKRKFAGDMWDKSYTHQMEFKKHKKDHSGQTTTQASTNDVTMEDMQGNDDLQEDPNVLTCPTCALPFAEYDELALHIASVHPRQTQRPEGASSTQTQASANYPVTAMILGTNADANRDGTYTCKLCGDVGLNAASITRHIGIQH